MEHLRINKKLQKVTFDEVEAQYVKFEVTQGFGNFATAAELAVYQKASDFSKIAGSDG